jgi:hypothetical protein
MVRNQTRPSRTVRTSKKSPSDDKPNRQADRRTRAEQEVSDLQDRVIRTVAAWEASDHNPGDLETVKREAPKLTNAMLSIPDIDLRPEWQIVKYEYGLYAAVMAGAMEEAKSQGGQRKEPAFAVRGLAASDHALKLIAEAQSTYTVDRRFERAATFVRDSDDQERTLYLRVVCYCQLVRTGKPDHKEDARHELDELYKINPTLESKYPTNANPEFANRLE